MVREQRSSLSTSATGQNQMKKGGREGRKSSGIYVRYNQVLNEREPAAEEGSRGPTSLGARQEMKLRKRPSDARHPSLTHFTCASLMSGAGRKQAPRLARPAARYWKGKAPKGIDAAALDADSDEEEEEEQVPHDAGDVALSGDVAFDEEDGEDEDEGQLARGPAAPRKGMNVSLRDVNISKDGKVTVAGREESGRTAAEAGAFVNHIPIQRAHAR
jgi:hypothetical protein